VALIGWAPVYVFAAVVATAAVIGWREYARMAAAHELAPLRGGEVYVAAFALSPLAGAHAPQLVAGLTLAIAPLALTAAMAGRDDVRVLLGRTATTALGLLWLGLLPAHLVFLRMLDGSQGPGLVFTLMLAVWGSDSAAWAVGSVLGRHTIAPRLSPKKTYEGLAGGIAGSIAGVFAGRALLAFDPGSATVLAGIEDPANAVALGLLIAITGFYGDLAASLLKRGAGVKDSGTILPGHGGILDRLDSLLFAAPVMYHWISRLQFY